MTQSDPRARPRPLTGAELDIVAHVFGFRGWRALVEAFTNHPPRKGSISMNDYHVTWQIDVEADNPVDAAREALDCQRDPDSIATAFEVVDSQTGVSTAVDFYTETYGTQPDSRQSSSE